MAAPGGGKENGPNAEKGVLENGVSDALSVSPGKQMYCISDHAMNSLVVEDNAGYVKKSGRMFGWKCSACKKQLHWSKTTMPEGSTYVSGAAPVRHCSNLTCHYCVCWNCFLVDSMAEIKAAKGKKQGRALRTRNPNKTSRAG